jgi:hypothetical protein
LAESGGGISGLKVAQKTNAVRFRKMSAQEHKKAPLKAGLFFEKLALLRGLSSSEGGFGLLSKFGKSGGVLDGDVGEDLAIKLDASLFQSVDELRVAGAVGLGGGRDADDPQGAELALLLLAAGVGELEAALDGFLGCLVELGFSKEVSTSSLENLFAAITPLGTTFYAGHLFSPFDVAWVTRLEAGGAAFWGSAVNLFTRSFKP